MASLKRSKDRKVSNSLTPSGGVRIANSFGLPSGKAYSCPGATSVCEEICYAGKLERLRPNVKSALMHNWDILREAEAVDMFEHLFDMIDDFEAECDKFKAPKEFRIHWDGDFFNASYIWAWQKVIDGHPDTHFWVYTRVEAAARTLQASNLTLYFSGDRDNIATAERMREAGIPVAMLGSTFEEAREAVGRGAMCPEQRGQVALNGACIACGICLKGKSNVLFSITKK